MVMVMAGWCCLWPGLPDPLALLTSPELPTALPSPPLPPHTGRSGRVFTLLRHEDVRHFKNMLRKADNTFVKDHRLGKGALEAVRDDVDSALDSMAQQLAAEQQHQQQQPAGGPAAVAAVLQALEGGPAAAAAAAAAARQGKQKQGQLAPGGQQQQRQGKAPKRRRLAGVPEFNLLAAQG